MTLLSVENLSVTLKTVRGPALAVRNLSFELQKGETLGIVGESGCGKSLTALAIMGLLPENGWADGRVSLGGENLLDYSEDQMCQVRGDRIGMVFQEPMTSLNPLHTVGKQIAEAMVLHRGMNRGEARAEVIRLLDLVGIPEPAKRVGSYPHQLSGGQRQRVMIAMALSCGPELLIADEPTTALDVTIQKQILDLIKNLIEDLGMAMILISHNLGVISQNVKDVIVMYGGTRVESGPTNDVFSDLSHPYSQGLFSAVPQIDDTKASRRRLTTIPGTVPELADLPAGCTFQGRCTYVTDDCRPTPPPVVQVADGHSVACLHIEAARTAWANR
jgi:peptide/nickel transport system ATP-binding protein